MTSAKRIHVLHVSKSTGGVGQYLRMLVQHIDKERFQITVICLSDGGEKLAAELSKVAGVKVHSLPMERYKINPLSDAKVWWQLARIIRQGKYDVIHAHTSKPGFLTRTAAIGSKIPTVYRPAGFAFHDGVPRWKAFFYAGVERVIATFFTDKILTVCEDERQLAKRYRVGSETQLVTVYTGIDLGRFDGRVDRHKIRISLKVPDQAFLIGTVGRLSKQKAPADFVNAAALTHQHFPDAHFVWVGDGELMGQMQELVCSLGLENVFHFAGRRDDIPDVLKAMDCFVLASHWEGFSLSVLESMAAGLPVIISQVSGAAEAVIDGETGRLVSIGDIRGLADAMQQFIADPLTARTFGGAGRRRVEQKFTLDRMVREIEHIYEHLSDVRSDNLSRSNLY
jgi:glycosyltransferase involved in cell wall biosynthesis